MVGNRRGEASRAGLLQAGRVAFGGQRYEEVSIVDLARSIGVAAGSISYHFGGKRGFYLAVIEQFADEFWSDLLQMRGPAIDRLHRGVDKLLDQAQRQPDAFQALIADVADAEVRLIHDRHRQRIADALAVEITGTESTPVLRAAINGCMAFIERIVLDWTRSQEISRAQVRDLIVANFYGALLGAVRADPGIELSQRVIDAVLSDPNLMSFIGFPSMTQSADTTE
ncbi:TetR/AcrR family transcriptional regulator [Nocardia jejuensis]|uniref:TetR/AcrR family transcriptional regulator n=1 Tax=Nocardia jejuensis TaxID=328049 RepID=UPI00082AB388|nr:TetR family transcriptional regulator [Nocardia jejuensis]